MDGSRPGRALAVEARSAPGPTPATAGDEPATGELVLGGGFRGGGEAGAAEPYPCVSVWGKRPTPFFFRERTMRRFKLPKRSSSTGSEASTIWSAPLIGAAPVSEKLKREQVRLRGRGVPGKGAGVLGKGRGVLGRGGASWGKGRGGPGKGRGGSRGRGWAVLGRGGRPGEGAGRPGKGLSLGEGAACARPTVLPRLPLEWSSGEGCWWL